MRRFLFVFLAILAVLVLCTEGRPRREMGGTQQTGFRCKCGDRFRRGFPIDTTCEAMGDDCQAACEEKRNKMEGRLDDEKKEKITQMVCCKKNSTETLTIIRQYTASSNVTTCADVTGELPSVTFNCEGVALANCRRRSQGKGHTRGGRRRKGEMGKTGFRCKCGDHSRSGFPINTTCEAMGDDCQAACEEKRNKMEERLNDEKKEKLTQMVCCMKNTTETFTMTKQYTASSSDTTCEDVTGDLQPVTFNCEDVDLENCRKRGGNHNWNG